MLYWHLILFKELNEMLNLLLYFLQILNEVIFKIKDTCTCPIWHKISVQFYEKVYTDICYTVYMKLKLFYLCDITAMFI